MCLAAAGAARTFLRGVLGDGVNDVDLRADWRRRGGLCPRHWRVWRGLESPAVSSTVLLRDLLDAALVRGDAAGGPPPRAWWRPTGSSAGPADAAWSPRCPACELERSAERRYLSALERVPAARLEAALAGGRGFACIAHLARLPDGPRRRLLRARLDELLADLDLFLRRSDHRFAHEPMGEAGDAWLRAIRALGGDV